MTAIQSPRVVDAAGAQPARSAAGTRFEQALRAVDRIDRPIAPSLVPQRDSGQGRGPTAQLQQTARTLNRELALMQRTGRADRAPEIAKQMQELDYLSTVVAKSTAKVGSAIKEVMTAA